MISVGSRDGRKRLGLGLEMEETELEEGEALSYRDEEEDSTIDPDIDLSYIEEKIQNVLGHFQKDFEGGVSAENLGAKFGGYGSFLPTYQRSPSWSHTRSPAEVRNYDSPRSPRKLHLEDQRQNSLASSSASPSARSGAASGKGASAGNSLKGNGYLQSRHAEGSSLKTEVSKKSVNPSDQRTLKVRIKVGSENLPTQKNAEIYSGLGLVVSPSSSLDDSPAASGGQCGKLLDVPEESPTSILQEKDTDIDTLGCEELVSNALKLPLLSSSQHDALKDEAKGEIFSSFTEKEHIDSESAQDIGRIEKLGGRMGSSGKVFESKKGNLASDIAACPKAEKSHALDQSESNVSKGSKALSCAEPAGPSKQAVVQKGGSVSEEGFKPVREKSSTGGKRKQKKDHERPRDRYKDFFGDVGFEDDDNESISGEMTSSGRLKDAQVVGKRSLSEDRNTSKEKYSGKSSEKPLSAEKYPRFTSHLAPPGSGPSSEAPIGMVPLVNEDWVSCDKCQKWRLLPLGTNPKSLPDKWLCRMLTWLQIFSWGMDGLFVDSQFRVASVCVARGPLIQERTKTVVASTADNAVGENGH
ncbi:UNVERIFIED_CONTAM: hypothetical protein Slati_0590500 [Sesamum latifolium]|uniref:CW-type domain-containing protein n=1 Tax=Sesamum latifolium TaxID=2727402 RepID=A0AAW2Y1P8_9LAMI